MLNCSEVEHSAGYSLSYNITLQFMFYINLFVEFIKVGILRLKFHVD